MLRGEIVDGYGSGNHWRINGEGEGNVVVHPHPPRDEVEHPIPLRQYFTDNGRPTGSNNMRVDGSVTPVEFSICADADVDLYVSAAAVVIADAGATLNKFGNLGTLTNGVLFEWVTQEFGTVVIHEGLKTNFDFVRLAGGKPAFGDAASAFRANNVSGTSEAYLPMIDFDEIFGLRWGMRLRRGTTDCLRFTIRDNVAGVDQFDVIGYGIKF